MIRLSVLPRTLDLDSGVDLVALSSARYSFEEALLWPASTGCGTDNSQPFFMIRPLRP
jgi:hypothetical protein